MYIVGTSGKNLISPKIVPDPENFQYTNKLKFKNQNL